MKIDIKKLATFSPLSALNADNLREIVAKSKVIELEADSFLFKQGAKDKNNYYLVSGAIEIIKNYQTIKKFKANDDESLHPIANQKPRLGSVKTTTKSVFYQVNSDLLDIMLTWDQTGSYSVDDLQDDGVWRTKIFQTKAFMKIPPANIHKFFMNMESVPFNLGDKVVKQDSNDDYFYIISKGRAMLTHTTDAKSKNIKLADLEPGDSFGEKALSASEKRNSTVTMLSKGVLMRLSKKGFLSLLAEPLLGKVPYFEAVKLIMKKSTTCIDVRLPSEFKKGHLKRAQSIPLGFLRMKLKTFSPLKTYIVYCDTGRRSSVVAHLMSEKGLNVKMLDNGMQNVPDVALNIEK
jgi:CRP-like cAMP-binding protein